MGLVRCTHDRSHPFAYRYRGIGCFLHASHDGLVESQARLRAVPVNELADGVIIRPLGTLRREAV